MNTSSPRRGSLQIGVFADNLDLPLRDGIRTAAELGADSFQMFTTYGEVLPENMNAEQAREFRKFYEDLGLQLSATCADFGGGFVDAAHNADMLPRMLAQIDLAVQLGTKVITTHIGTIPPTPDATWDVMRVALDPIGQYADEHGIALATETGPESGPVLRDFLLTVNNHGIRVNLDPANLIARGFDLDEALDALIPYIVHTHAKDHYGEVERGEAPLGKGAVPWPHYIARLKAAGYHGAYTIEREAGEDRIGDVREAIAFLRQF